MTALITPPTKTITLEQGVKLGENTITEITITKPLVSHLKGVSLKNLMDMQTDEITKIIPRVTTPSLPPHALDSMDFTEFMQVASEVLGFLMGVKNTDTPDE